MEESDVDKMSTLNVAHIESGLLLLPVRVGARPTGGNTDWRSVFYTENILIFVKFSDVL